MIYFNNKKIKNKNKVNNNDRLLHLNNHKQRKHSIFNAAIIWIRGLKDYDDYKNNSRKQAIYIYIYMCVCVCVCMFLTHKGKKKMLTLKLIGQ